MTLKINYFDLNVFYIKINPYTENYIMLSVVLIIRSVHTGYQEQLASVCALLASLGRGPLRQQELQAVLEERLQRQYRDFERDQEGAWVAACLRGERHFEHQRQVVDGLGAKVEDCLGCLLPLGAGHESEAVVREARGHVIR